MFGAFNTFGKLGAPAGSRSLLAQIQSMGASFIGIPSLSNYQDSAGTTLVTQPGGGSADPPVGLVVDLSGNGRKARQATSTARPKLSARVNICDHTEDFSNSAWTKTALTVSTSELLVPTVTSTQHSIQYTASIPTAESWTVEAKAAGYKKISLREGATTGAWVVVDLSTGLFVASGNGLTGYTITVLSDGYVRVTLQKSTSEFGAKINFLPDSYTSGDPNGAAFAGDGVSGVLVRKPQLELGSTSSRYQAVTDASNYDYSGFPFVHVFDGVDDAHVITFPSSLGSACTVVTANRGTTPTIQTGQTIGTSYTITTTHAGKLIFPRALTAGETAIVTAWATKQGAIA